MKIYELNAERTVGFNSDGYEVNKEIVVGYYLHKETAEHDKQLYERYCNKNANIKEIDVCEIKIKGEINEN